MASMPLPEIEKFMPLWVFGSGCMLALAAFVAVCVVLMIATRKRKDD